MSFVRASLVAQLVKNLPVNNIRYADDTTLIAESEEELKSLLMKVKVESGKVGLKLSIQKMKIMEIGRASCRERVLVTV